MPRISTYAVDTVDKNDKLIGTSSSGGTKNFEIQDVSKFFKETNAAGIAAQFVFQYKSDGTRQSGRITATFSSGVTFANLTSVEVNNKIYGETDPMVNLLSILGGKDILILDIDNQNNFGVYTAGTPTQDSGTDYYDISLGSPQTSNGSLVNNRFYAIVVFGGGSDKHKAFEDYYEQADAANPWVVTHSLGKFPSVTVINRSDVEVQAQVTHNNNNQVTITFAGATAGKAYFN